MEVGKKVEFKETLHPSEEQEGVVQLRTRLIAENYLSKTDTSSSIVYDEKLQKAVKKFQILHGLNGDGVIGKGTLKIINTSIEKNQEKIICNLERRRWMQYPKDTAYIKVNIASFKMEFIKDKKVTYESNVVVGKTKNKTPFFMDYLELIVLNPTWTLPYSISSRETLGKLKRNPNYLAAHNMFLMDKNGKKISSQGIDWSTISSRNFPYRVRQGPGAGNALGCVKFLFPNKYAIYLHDTPSKRLFSRDKRAFSHGCIRLENPLQFAEFLLKKEDASWDKKKIDKIIATSKTKTIRLKNVYPVLLIYQTAATNKNNELIYYSDVYKRDAKLYKLLTKK